MSLLSRRDAVSLSHSADFAGDSWWPVFGMESAFIHALLIVAAMVTSCQAGEDGDAEVAAAGDGEAVDATVTAELETRVSGSQMSPSGGTLRRKCSFTPSGQRA